MFDDSCFSDEITNFGKLRTGHARLKVVVADEKHQILFIARVFQSRLRTTGTIRFDNNQVFYVSSRTVARRRVSLFLWTEDLEFLWRRQCEVEKISRWLEAARPEDVIVFADFVADESGRTKIKLSPPLAVYAKHQISKRLPELGLVQLQRLAGMLYAVSDQIAA
jgi:hypothetical protein